MNSVEAYKSFITFLILIGTLILSVFGFNLIIRNSNQNANANRPKDIQRPSTQNPAKDEQTSDVNDNIPNSLSETPLNEPIKTDDTQINPNQVEEQISTEKTDTSPVKETTIESAGSFSGFEDSVEYNSNTMVLGRSTNQLNQAQINEFKDAIKFQDIRYDFNNDAIVDIKDYPLFIAFSNNKED